MLGRVCPWGCIRQEGRALITPLPLSRDTAALANASKVGTRAGVGDKESGIPKPVLQREERHPMTLSGHSSPTGAVVSLSTQRWV